MKNKSGQALVEFVMILPVFFIIIFSFIDFCRVILEKNNLENTINDIVMMYENNEDTYTIKNKYEKKDKDIDISFVIKDETTIIINKKIDPITPGLNYLPKDIFEISAKRIL